MCTIIERIHSTPNCETMNGLCRKMCSTSVKPYPTCTTSPALETDIASSGRTFRICTSSDSDVSRPEKDSRSRLRRTLYFVSFNCFSVIESKAENALKRMALLVKVIWPVLSCAPRNSRQDLAGRSAKDVRIYFRK